MFSDTIAQQDLTCLGAVGAAALGAAERRQHRIQGSQAGAYPVQSGGLEL